MWGSWFGVTLGGLLVVLLIVAIAFGTSAQQLPVHIVALIALGAAGISIFNAGTHNRPVDRSLQPDPVEYAAPASGEGPPPPTEPR
jgi:hypothetical protein